MGTGSESMDITKAELLTALKRMNDFQQDTQDSQTLWAIYLRNVLGLYRCLIPGSTRLKVY